MIFVETKCEVGFEGIQQFMVASFKEKLLYSVCIHVQKNSKHKYYKNIIFLEIQVLGTLESASM